MSIDNEIETIRKALEAELDIEVKVALFGQPGAGKSSLVNAIVGSKVAAVGVETDKTVEASEPIHFNGLVFVDLPGYGTAMFPKETYFTKFDLTEYDLFLCVSSGKLHQADTEFFQRLADMGKECVFVINKHDELWEDGVSIEELERRKVADIHKHVGEQVDVVFTSCRTKKGMEDLNNKIKDSLAGAKRERWVRSAHAYSQQFLDEKKKSCEKSIAIASWVAAANGANPIPGVNVAVDVSVLLTMFESIRNDFGLTEQKMDQMIRMGVPAVAPIAERLVLYATSEGIVLLLRQFAGRAAAKEFARYIPFVGQAVSAGLGYAITSNAGAWYLEECHKIASEILKQDLQI